MNKCTSYCDGSVDGKPMPECEIDTVVLNETVPCSTENDVTVKRDETVSTSENFSSGMLKPSFCGFQDTPEINSEISHLTKRKNSQNLKNIREIEELSAEDLDDLSEFEELESDQDEYDDDTFDGFGCVNEVQNCHKTSDHSVKQFEGFSQENDEQSCDKKCHLVQTNVDCSDKSGKEIFSSSSKIITSSCDSCSFKNFDSNTFEGFDMADMQSACDMFTSKMKSEFILNKTLTPEPSDTSDSTFNGTKTVANKTVLPSKDPVDEFIGPCCNAVGCDVSWLESGNVKNITVTNGIVVELMEFAKKIAWEKEYVAEWLFRLCGYTCDSEKIAEEDLQKIHMVNKRRKAISVTFSGKHQLKSKLCSFDAEKFQLPSLLNASRRCDEGRNDNKEPVDKSVTSNDYKRSNRSSILDQFSSTFDGESPNQESRIIKTENPLSSRHTFQSDAFDSKMLSDFDVSDLKINDENTSRNKIPVCTPSCDESFESKHSSNTGASELNLNILLGTEQNTSLLSFEAENKKIKTAITETSALSSNGSADYKATESKMALSLPTQVETATSSCANHNSSEVLHQDELNKSKNISLQDNTTNSELYHSTDKVNENLSVSSTDSIKSNDHVVASEAPHDMSAEPCLDSSSDLHKNMNNTNVTLSNAAESSLASQGDIPKPMSAVGRKIDNRYSFGQNIIFASKKGKNDHAGKDVQYPVFEIRDNCIGPFCSKEHLDVKSLNVPLVKVNINNGMIIELYIFFKERGATLSSLVLKLHQLMKSSVKVSRLHLDMARIQEVVNVDIHKKTDYYLEKLFIFSLSDESALSATPTHCLPVVSSPAKLVLDFKKDLSEDNSEASDTLRKSNENFSNKVQDVTESFLEIDGDAQVLSDLKDCEGKIGIITRGDIVRLYYNWLKLKTKDNDSVFVIDLLNEVEKLMLEREIEVIRIPVGTLMSSSVKLYEEYQRFRGQSKADAMAYLREDWLEDIHYLVSMSKTKEPFHENVGSSDQRDEICPFGVDKVKEGFIEDVNKSVKQVADIAAKRKYSNNNMVSVKRKKLEIEKTDDLISLYPPISAISGSSFIDLTFDFKIETILSCRLSSTTEGLTYEYLIHWSGKKKIDDTWVAESDFPTSCIFITNFWESNPDKRMSIVKVLDGQFDESSGEQSYLVLWEKYSSQSWIVKSHVPDDSLYMIEEFDVQCGNSFSSAITGISDCNRDFTEEDLSEDSSIYSDNTRALCDDVSSVTMRYESENSKHEKQLKECRYEKDERLLRKSFNSFKRYIKPRKEFLSASHLSEAVAFFQTVPLSLYCKKSLSQSHTFTDSILDFCQIPSTKNAQRKFSAITKGQILSIYDSWRASNVSKKTLCLDTFDGFRNEIKAFMESLGCEYEYDDCLLAVCYNLHLARQQLTGSKQITAFNKSDCIPYFQHVKSEQTELLMSLSKQAAVQEPPVDMCAGNVPTQFESEQILLTNLLDKLKGKMIEIEGIVNENSSNNSSIIEELHHLRDIFSFIENDPYNSEDMIKHYRGLYERKRAVDLLKGDFGLNSDAVENILKRIPQH